MSNTMTAAHEPINYLDSILNEEEKRCEYSHQWRNFTISRSGRFKSKTKKREVVDGKLFDCAPSNSNNAKDLQQQKLQQQQQYQHQWEQSKISGRQSATNPTSSSYKPFQAQSTSMSSQRNQRDKGETYKSFYETNL